MKSVDSLLERQYDAKNYHCVHFVIDAAKYLCNIDYTQQFLGLAVPLDLAVQASRQTIIQSKRLRQPKNGCVVMMTNLLNSSHVGLFYCDHVLHLTEFGVHFQALRSLQRNYSRFRFYEAQNIL